MKAPLEIDLEDPTLTPPIRAILDLWREVDWFTPCGSSDVEGARLVRAHHELARRHGADQLPANLDVRPVTGGWPDFVTWCTRVRGPSQWDWKYSVLKPLLKAHSARLGWTDAALPRESSLVFRLVSGGGNDVVIWRGLSADLGALPPGPAGECATFYRGYAHQDLVAAIEWQLAEAHDDLADNPFVALLRCYRAGFYPFALDAATVTLFRFAAADTALPRARLVSR